MDELMIRIDNVSKMYKLGEIGGTTLREELQRFNAKLRGKEDPTKRIGAKNYNKGETFMALDGVSFEVKKGERVGIIGHNGAGKSTLLKLISRVTAPTCGKIGLNGRVASMLEVGTGFHRELTGRENIYMNGAILGMTKREIDDKIENIIEFSECRQFIDTPIKRYSSGMYVKLAFSVAAHLDAEIMIMDEVLAVGDMAFQKKCLKKMKEVSEAENRTILYVSHNMNTIRALCERCVVLDHGSVKIDGEVEEAIHYYFSDAGIQKQNNVDLNKKKHDIRSMTGITTMTRVVMSDIYFHMGEHLLFDLELESKKRIASALLRFTIHKGNGCPIGMTCSDLFPIHEGVNRIKFDFDLDGMTNGDYYFDLILCDYEGERQTHLDSIQAAMAFGIGETINYYNLKWRHNLWGDVKFRNVKVIN